MTFSHFSHFILYHIPHLSIAFSFLNILTHLTTMLPFGSLEILAGPFQMLPDLLPETLNFDS